MTETPSADPARQIRNLISEGHFARAYELAQDLLRQDPGRPDAAYLAALALARAGNAGKAEQIAGDLFASGGMPPELLVEVASLLGRVAKDRFRHAGSAPEAVRRGFASLAADRYEDAYRLPEASTFPGVNAATMALLAGQPERARSLARDVSARAEAERAAADPSMVHWHEAALGEAAVILGDLEAARRWYASAFRRVASRRADLVAMRRQLELLAPAVPGVESILALTDPGTVVVFAGHMVDHPSRPAPRFPADPRLEDAVGRAIGEVLEELNCICGYSSAACGGDILFMEQLQQRATHDRPVERHVTLPFLLDDFYFTSVDFGYEGRASWRTRCEALLNTATSVGYATREHYHGDDGLFRWVNVFTQGMALIRAEQLGARVCALTLVDLDGVSPDRVPTGGTLDFLDSWRAAGLRVRFVDLADIRRTLGPLHPRPPGHTSPAPPTVSAVDPHRSVKAMLFADVKNYSQLDEEHAPRFFSTFLGLVAAEIATLPVRPEFQNTWGDGLYMVFPDVVSCADFALRLLDRVGSTAWTELGLPEDTAVRIGLHAGPVFRFHDPVIERENFFGSHVNRAARTEPVTPPGAACTSDQFAAALAIAPGHRFACEFAGVEWLAKGYDRCSLFSLVRRA